MRQLLIASGLLCVAFCAAVVNGVYERLTEQERVAIRRSASASLASASEAALRQVEAQLDQPRAQIAEQVKALGDRVVDSAHHELSEAVARAAEDAKRQIAARADAALAGAPRPPEQAVVGEAKP